MTKHQRLSLVQRYWDEAVELNRTSHLEAKRTYEYLRGNQLPDDVVSILAARNQPAHWENIIRQFDQTLDGLKRQSRTTIEVNMHHDREETRDRVIEAVFRSTAQGDEWYDVKEQADRDMRIAGIGVIESRMRTLSETDAHGKHLREVYHTHIPALESWIDLHSRRSDYADARYFHHRRLYDREGIVAVYGSRAKGLTETEHGLVPITRTWYRDGETIRIMTWSDGVVLEDVPQPYTRTRGRFSVAVRRVHAPGAVREYYGIYRDILPYQDKINFLMLRVMNMIGTTKVLFETSAVDDPDMFMEEFNLDNSINEVSDGALSQNKIEVIKHTADVSQILSLVQDARYEAMKVMGVNPELFGASTTRQSGVALEIKQNAAMTGLERMLNMSNRLDRDTFWITLGIMAEWFSAEQVFAITGKHGKRERYYLNEYIRDDRGRIVWRDGRPLQRSILDIGRYDIVVNTAPASNGSTDTKMKAWAEMMKIVPPDRAAALIPSMLRDVDSPQAEETQEILERLDQQAAQSGQNDPAAQMHMQTMQAQLEQMQARVADLMAKAQLNQAKAEEIRAEIASPSDENGAKAPAPQNPAGQMPPAKAEAVPSIAPPSTSPASP